MARKPGSTIVQEELPYASDRAREDLDDPRLVDLDVEEESPFMRGQKRVSARRGSISKKSVNYLMWTAIAAGILCASGLVAAGLYDYGKHSWRFRIESRDNIEVAGTQNVSMAQVMEVMGADIERNIFFVPLDQQKLQLEQIPWVESASIMRFVPNRLRIEIRERQPVAFARIGPRIQLIDASGVLMELPRHHKYSFPVVIGMNPGEPVSTRVPRMKTYVDMLSQLDSGGARYSHDLSEVDLTDPDNTKVRVNDPAGDVLVQLGSSNFAERYKVYLSHIQGWRQQFQKVESVDLRYDNQIIVNPDFEKAALQTRLTPVAAKAAAAAGVKPAALVTRLPLGPRPQPKPVFGPPVLKKKPPAASKTAKSRSRVRAHQKKPALKFAKSAAAPTTTKSPKAPVQPTGTNTGQKPSAAVANAQPAPVSNQ